MLVCQAQLRKQKSRTFYEIAHFPGVLGLVDGTHIRIQKPSENVADYVNRHYHSINVQVICRRMVYLAMC